MTYTSDVTTCIQSLAYRSEGINTRAIKVPLKIILRKQSQIPVQSIALTKFIHEQSKLLTPNILPCSAECAESIRRIRITLFYR